MNAPRSDMVVEEIQGLYGPFTFSELLFQKIWAERAFDQSQLETLEGEPVRIVSPGRWNRLAGPDFVGARIAVGQSKPQTMDVELHLRAEDWGAHGHAGDRAYAEVDLHVVLFPPPPGWVTGGFEGREIATVALLPWLYHDLEEYAAEAAVESLANRPESQLLKELREMPPEELRRRLDKNARKRWEQKVHFAGVRIAKVGWEAACHQTALEIMGYRYNRAPMMRVGLEHGLADWSRGSCDVVSCYEAYRDQWRASGVRPANHPRRRLQQYQQWVEQCPDWPTRLLELGGALPQSGCEENTAEVRRREGFTRLRSRVAEEICGEALSGPRLDTMICDGFWPLLASRTGEERMGVWYHWFVGDAPEAMVKLLRQAGRFEGRRAPASHGGVQGLLGQWLEREGRMAR